MKFDLIDRVLEQSDDRIVALKHVTRAEEYLQDHFPTFPVLPGVMMVETMVQAVEASNDSLGSERARIVEACFEPCSVAELAVELGMALGVVIVLVGDLVEAGYLETTHSDPVEIELDELTRMIERVRAL